MMNKEKTIGWNFDNSYSNLPKSFIYEISPVPVKRPELVIFNHDLADQMGLNFSNVDNVVSTTGIEQKVEAPKDVETLNKIAEINNAKRKEEEGEDDGKLVIGGDVTLDVDSISLDTTPILGDIVSL